MTYSYPLTIIERHLDTFGHVNNAVYLEIFEEARWSIINGNGYGMQKIKETGLGPVILEIQMRFLRELKLHEKVIVKSEAMSYKGKIGLFLQWMENEAGERCCEADFKIGLFDLKKRRLVPPTPEWSKAIGLNQ